MNGIVYYCGGVIPSQVIEVSIWSLRKHYKGPITVFTDSHDTRHKLDICLNRHNATVKVLQVAPYIRAAAEQAKDYKSSRYIHRVSKLLAVMQSPYTRTLWLDTDTLVLADPSPLFINKMGFTTVVDKKGDRIYLNDNHKVAQWTKSKLYEIRNINWSTKILVDQALEENLPLINTGVFVATKGHPFLLPWFLLGGSTANIGVGDQYAAITLLPTCNDTQWIHHTWNAVRGLSGKWNKDNKKIRHYTGSSWEGSGQWKKARKDMLRELRSEHEDFSDHNHVQ